MLTPTVHLVKGSTHDRRCSCREERVITCYAVVDVDENYSFPLSPPEPENISCIVVDFDNAARLDQMLVQEDRELMHRTVRYT